MLAVIMIMCSFSCVTAFAVTYPEGVTKAQAEASLTKAEKLVGTLLSMSDKKIDIGDSIYSMLFSDKVISKILIGVYSQMSANESTLKTMGVDMSVASVAGKLSKYEDVSKKLLLCDSWDTAAERADSFVWGVNSKESFEEAFAAIMSPFDTLLYTLLCSGSYKLNSILTIKGDDGYTNAIVPVLTSLGCKNIMSAADYKAAADKDRSSMIKNIIIELFSVIDEISAAPVTGLTEKLPSVAYFLTSDGLSNALEKLVSPLKIRVGHLITLTGISKLVDSSAMLQDSGSLSDMLSDISLSELTGSDIQLKMPEIKLEELASCGKVENGKYVTDKGASFITVMRFLIDTVKLNSVSLGSFIGGADANASLSGIADKILAKDTDSLVSLLINLMTADGSSTVNNYSWTYKTVTPAAVSYTANLTQENYQKVLDEIDALLNEVVVEYADAESLGSLLAGKIYSNSLVSTLTVSLYSALGGNETKDLFSALGYDFSPAGLAASLGSNYSSAKKTLSSAASWDSVKESSLKWGFYDGSKSGFISAVTAVLRPMMPLLRVLLAGGSIKILDCIDVYGSNGYNSAVIPMLEAFGCDASQIKSYSSYVSSAGTDAVITDILTPLCSLIDTVLARPVFTLTAMLPNISYFIENGGMKTVINNLLYPVTSLLEKLSMSDMMPSELASFGDADITSLLKNVTSGISFKLPELDIAQFAGMGTAETAESRATVNGSSAQFTYIKADQTAVLITLLRYFVGALSLEENKDALSGLMSSDGGNNMMSMYAGDITSQFESMSTDEIIEWLYNLLFRETPKTEPVTEDTFIPTVIYEPEKKTSAAKYVIIVLVLVIIAVTAVVLIAKYAGDPDKKEEKRRLKLKEKAAETESGKKTGKKKSKKKKQKVPAPEDTSAVTKKEKKKSEKKMQAALKEAQQYSAETKVTFKEARPDKLQKAKDKAAKKALRDTKKADKYYEQALKQSAKKK